MKSLVNAIKFDSLVKTAGHITGSEKLVGAFLAVRDIPYGGKNTKNPDDIIENNLGTGSGKHLLLAGLFRKLGYEVQSYLARHDFGQYPLEPWPKELQAFRGHAITGYHDFVKVHIGERWVTVDATFDHALAAFGFPDLEWDGKSDMELAITAQEEILVDEGMHPSDLRRQLLSALPKEVQDERVAFLQALKKWIGEERTKGE